MALTGRPNKQNSEKVDNRAERTRPTAITVQLVTGEREPSWGLGKYGEEEYRRLTRALSNTGTLSEIDNSLLESACRAWNVYRQAEENMSDFLDRFETTDKGNLILSPRAIESKRQLDIYSKIVVQFGVTPLSRMRITTKPKEEEAKDPMGELMKMYGG